MWLGISTVECSVWKSFARVVCEGLNSAEVYDPRVNEWRLVASMSTRRSSVGVGVVAGPSLCLCLSICLSVCLSVSLSLSLSLSLYLLLVMI